MNREEKAPVLSHAEPVLAVSNVVETVQYWHDVLGFPDKWTWGEPPNHGGVVWQGAFVQFSQEPQLASRSKGNSIFIRVRNLETLYEFHQRSYAEIASPLENKPWGMAGYSLREINGYYVTFAGAPISIGSKTNFAGEKQVNLAFRIPTAKEYLDLVSAVGWDKFTNSLLVDKILAAPVYGVVAEDEATRVIGCALLLSDGASFYYVKDVMVHPEWQSRRVGSMLMSELTRWLDANAPDHAFVGLFTGENLAGFYRQFNFAPAFGMFRRIQRP